MRDLLYDFNNPSVMDIKIGTRTFLESEVSNTKARNDLYLKVSFVMFLLTYRINFNFLKSLIQNFIKNIFKVEIFKFVLCNQYNCS